MSISGTDGTAPPQRGGEAPGTQPVLPAGYALRVFDVIDSTNEQAHRMAAAGQTAPVWIMAAQQSAGRGRRGRAWHSPAGNLMATLLFAPDCPQARAGEASFVAALAVRDALCDLLGESWTHALHLKWPNDLLLAGGKVAGLLLERTRTGAHSGPLAVGIGVNLAHHPADTLYPATSVRAQTGIAPSPAAALEALARAWETRRRQWAPAAASPRAGFAAIRRDWLDHARGIGEAVTVRLPGQTITGRFLGIDATGALELQQDSGRRRIWAADVFPLAAGAGAPAAGVKPVLRGEVGKDA